MNESLDIELIESGLEVHTRGLLAHCHPELSATVADVSLLGECNAFLRYVTGYILDNQKTITPGQTLGYGYWLVKFELRDDRMLQVWEWNAGATELVPGATLAMTYWRDQHLICYRFGAVFSPPRPDQLVVLSDGVLEGEPVQGVRYSSPEHMSGWWITTDLYDGDISSLRQDHLYHLTSVRSDLARYVALPYGFRFDLTQSEDVWFEQEAASEPE